VPRRTTMNVKQPFQVAIKLESLSYEGGTVYNWSNLKTGRPYVPRRTTMNVKQPFQVAIKLESLSYEGVNTYV
jgi:hypothetical protein